MKINWKEFWEQAFILYFVLAMVFVPMAVLVILIKVFIK